MWEINEIYVLKMWVVHMKRTLLDGLMAWKNKKNRLPLILKGARQVGKTWLLNEFGRQSFDDVLYINFENTPGLKETFDGDISPRRILDLLGALHSKKIEPQETLLIFDEVQEIPRALTALKYFAENAPSMQSAVPVRCLALHCMAALHSQLAKSSFLTYLH